MATKTTNKETGDDRTSHLMSTDEWDKISGQEYGGQADILEIGVGEIAGPFKYLGHQPMVMEGGKQVTVHLGVDREDEQVRLPIAASFLRAIDQAGIAKGDTFAVRRLEDVPKKQGVGRGQMMKIYSIKVMSKAPVQAQV